MLHLDFELPKIDFTEKIQNGIRLSNSSKRLWISWLILISRKNMSSRKNLNFHTVHWRATLFVIPIKLLNIRPSFCHVYYLNYLTRQRGAINLNFNRRCEVIYNFPPSLFPFYTPKTVGTFTAYSLNDCCYCWSSDKNNKITHTLA